jgi:hypothetical protein
MAVDDRWGQEAAQPSPAAARRAPSWAKWADWAGLGRGDRAGTSTRGGTKRCPIRGYSANTRDCYLRRVRHFVRHFMVPPNRLTPEHGRQGQLYVTRDRHV